MQKGKCRIIPKSHGATNAPLPMKTTLYKDRFQPQFGKTRSVHEKSHNHRLGFDCVGGYVSPKSIGFVVNGQFYRLTLKHKSLSPEPATGR